jgi:hypothetical protein
MFSADRRSHVRSPEKWHRLENEFFNRIGRSTTVNPYWGQCFDVRHPRLPLAAAKEEVVLSICARDAAQVTNEQRTREVAVRRRFRQGAAASAPD